MVHSTRWQCVQTYSGKDCFYFLLSKGFWKLIPFPQKHPLPSISSMEWIHIECGALQVKFRKMYLPSTNHLVLFQGGRKPPKQRKLELMWKLKWERANGLDGTQGGTRFPNHLSKEVQLQNTTGYLSLILSVNLRWTIQQKHVGSTKSLYGVIRPCHPCEPTAREGKERAPLSLHWITWDLFRLLDTQADGLK